MERINKSDLKFNRFYKTRLAIIFVLASLLIFYHISKVYDLYLGDNTFDYSMLVNIQSVIRIFIVFSLTMLLFGYKLGLTGMWITITLLTITRYVLLFEQQDISTIEFSEYLSYLRGFIFPTIITLCYPKTQS